MDIPPVYPSNFCKLRKHGPQNGNTENSICRFLLLLRNIHDSPVSAGAIVHACMHANILATSYTRKWHSFDMIAYQGHVTVA